MPTGTVTFLFTDIEGSTTLLQRLGDRRYAEVLQEHQTLLRAAFEQGNGREVDRQGDSFLVAFSRGREAIGAAVAAQLALTKHLWPEGAALRVRMGLHTGEPLNRTSDYVGLDVHRAARICAAGHGGQIPLSRALEVLAARDLPPDVTLRNMGAHRLKDLKDPEHLFQVIHPDLPADFPTLKSLDARPNNLPIELTSFIGRDREKTEVGRLLFSTHLVTLTGSGGAGKTRLALQVAAELLDQYSDGVWFVELAALSDPSLVPTAVATILNVQEPRGSQLPIIEILVDFLRSKSILLVVDNCEHLLPACAGLSDRLPSVVSGPADARDEPGSATYSGGDHLARSIALISRPGESPTPRATQ
jgi:class 3 adenylate cyclase